MGYDEISQAAEELSYRDKFRLAQLLIQLARKEEEQQKPNQRASTLVANDPELVEYVIGRLRKLKPGKRDSLLNSIGAMFQFQGAISDADKEQLIAVLESRGHIKIESNRVTYAEAQR